MALVYQNYGVTNLSYVSEDVGHDFGYGKMVPGLKQMFVDLGYATDMDDFNDLEYDFKDFGTWKRFDQRDFVGIDSTNSDGEAWRWKETQWGKYGKVYIPTACESTTCKVHIAFHGCTSNAADIAWYSDYNEFAANNELIVIYPNTYCWGEDNMIDDPEYLT